MPTTESEKEASIRLDRENSEIRAELGNAMLAWSALEHVISDCFSILAFKKYQTPLSGVIFFSPSNFETRLRLTDDVVAFTLDDNQILRDRWSAFKGRLKKKQRVRNAIAHGELTTQYVDGKNYIRLSPSIADTARWKNISAPHGLTGNDIGQFIEAVGRLGTIGLLFNRCCGAHLGVPSFHQPEDGKSLAELVDELDGLMIPQTVK